MKDLIPSVWTEKSMAPKSFGRQMLKHNVCALLVRAMNHHATFTREKDNGSYYYRRIYKYLVEAHTLAGQGGIPVTALLETAIACVEYVRKHTIRGEVGKAYWQQLAELMDSAMEKADAYVNGELKIAEAYGTFREAEEIVKPIAKLDASYYPTKASIDPKLEITPEEKAKLIASGVLPREQ